MELFESDMEEPVTDEDGRLLGGCRRRYPSGEDVIEDSGMTKMYFGSTMIRVVSEYKRRLENGGVETISDEWEMNYDYKHEL